MNGKQKGGLEFELHFRREAYKRVGGKFVRDEDRDERLPERPEAFVPRRGSYTYVSNEAVRLNDVQMRAGFLDHLYFPDVATPRPAPPK